MLLIELASLAAAQSHQRLMSSPAMVRRQNQASIRRLPGNAPLTQGRCLEAWAVDRQKSLADAFR